MQIVSADQFVDGLIAALCLEGKSTIDMDRPEMDEQFAKAYDEFLEQAESLRIVPDFVIAADPFYGDSTCLRDAILAARDVRSVSLNNPRFVSLSIRMDNKSADQVLDAGIIPRPVLQNLAKKYLVEVAE